MKIVQKVVLATMIFTMLFTIALPVFMAGSGVAVLADEVAVSEIAVEANTGDDVKGDKAMAAAIVVGIAAAVGAASMAWAITKSADSIARQPEVESKIRTTLMLGLVFIETAIIYALIIAILIIFVL